MTRRILLALITTTILGCSSSGGAGVGGDDVGGDDAPSPDASEQPVTIPTWQLEDIQPQSPRVNEVYGLEGFANKTVVVALVQGF